jgi:hypothetical protein
LQFNYGIKILQINYMRLSCALFLLLTPMRNALTQALRVNGGSVYCQSYQKNKDRDKMAMKEETGGKGAGGSRQLAGGSRQSSICSLQPEVNYRLLSPAARPTAYSSPINLIIRTAFGKLP